MTQKNYYEGIIKEKDSRITTLEATCENMRRQNEGLKSSRDQTKNEQKIAALENKNARLEAMIEEMQSWVNSCTETDTVNPEELDETDVIQSNTGELTDEQLKLVKNKRILFVCQHDGMCRKLKEFFPKCSVSINGYEVNSNTAAVTDIVVFITKDISHPEYFRVKYDCIHYGVNYCNTNCISMKRIAADIYSQIA